MNMEIVYDVWMGEGIESILQTTAEFRLQVLGDHHLINNRLSDEINHLTHYLDDEAIIIVANDGGRFVGYISAVNYSESHPNFLDYAHFGDDLKVSQGPIVHPMYRKMGIGTELIRELINECQIRDIECLGIDPISDELTETGSLNDHLLGQFNFEVSGNSGEKVYKKALLELT